MNDYKDKKKNAYTTDFITLNDEIRAAVAANLETESDILQLNLNPLYSILNMVREKGKTAIIRFHYDPCNAGFQYYYTYLNDKGETKVGSEYFDYEPEDLNTIIGNDGHIKQICDVLAQYQDIITAVECGLLGPWGEMHGTTYGDGYLTAEQFAGFAQGNITGAYNVSSLPVEKDETDGLDKFKKGTSLLVVRKYLEEMQAHGINCPLLLRYPLTLYYYAVAFEGASLTDSLPLDYDPEEHKTDLGYRLGMYNDGYLGSYSDYGTFTLKKSSSLTSGMQDGWEKDRIRSRRSEEVAVLEKYLRHTAYGGELLAGESDTKPAFWDKVPSEACEEMKLVHLSYLNISHNYHAFEALDTSSYTYGGQNLFHYILSHMGYRYIITNLDQQPVSAHGKNVHINLGIVNDGVTEMPFHRVKGFKVYLIPAGQNPSSSATAFSAEGEFKGDYSKQDVSEIERYVSTSVEASSLSAGNYDVYLKVCDITGNSLTDGKHAIRFANEGIWNETLSANKLGTITIE